jgi:hypothetical protein
MEYLLEPPAQFIGSAILAIAGCWFGVRGLGRYFAAAALPASNPTKSLDLMHAFRVAIIGISVASLGISWATEMLWLAILSLVVLGEETFETTMAIGAMNYGKPRKTRPAPPPAKSTSSPRTAGPVRTGL